MSYAFENTCVAVVRSSPWYRPGDHKRAVKHKGAKGTETFNTISKVQESSMINISHPKLRGKPPLKKCPQAKDVESKAEDMAKEQISGKKRDVDDNEMAKKADYNQNIIESTTSSFEQLCNMISDLEKNIAGEATEMDRFQV